MNVSVLYISVKNVTGVLLGIALSLFMIVILLICECGTSSYFLVSSGLFLYCFYFFVEVFTFLVRFILRYAYIYLFLENSDRIVYYFPDFLLSMFVVISK